MTPNRILWVYIVVLVAGGLVGLLKANSKISLIMSLAFAAALALCATDIVQVPRLADIILIFLVVFFVLRFAKSKKFVPAGLMSVLTAATLAWRHWAYSPERGASESRPAVALFRPCKPLSPSANSTRRSSAGSARAIASCWSLRPALARPRRVRKCF